MVLFPLQDGVTALGWAATYDYVEVVKVLILHGANLDLQDYMVRHCIDYRTLKFQVTLHHNSFAVIVGVLTVRRVRSSMCCSNGPLGGGQRIVAGWC